MSGLDQLSNEELLHRYQSADAEAFEAFFERNRRLIFHYLYGRLGSVQEAEDAFQKTFLKIHRYILKYDRTQSALGWVFAIARNVAIDTYSLRKETETKLDTETKGPVTSPTEILEAREKLARLLADLSPIERRLVERRFLSEDSFDQIGREQGWSAANTRQKTSRLLRKLRAHMADLTI